MAKIYGLFGTMTGKLADTVMSVRNGEQIARKYQPVVFNPSTPAQIATRAKLKLMSQLSSVMAPVIAIPREGSVSPRNLFVKSNYGLATFAENQADITLTSVQLTRSVVALPEVALSNYGETIRASLDVSVSGGALDVNRVVYCEFVKQADGKLRYVASQVVSEKGTNGDYPTTSLPLAVGEVVVLGYGVRDNTENARAVFGNMQAVQAETVAKLIVTRTLTETDITLSETRGASLVVPAPTQNTVHSLPAEGEMRSSKKK